MTKNQTPLADLEAQAAILRRELLAKLRTRTAARSATVRAILRGEIDALAEEIRQVCLLYTSPSPRDRTRSRMPSSA